MSSRRRPAGGVKSVQGDLSPSGTTKKRVSREEESNQRRSRRAEEIRSHQNSGTNSTVENGPPQRHWLASLLMMVIAYADLILQIRCSAFPHAAPPILLPAEQVGNKA
ncbi:hypothetical protein AMECASPLE_033832 [Ameca splendens]|uniref:Uncharacterized protein n=1 Tax=Ameca splendens TaxID=208324 RepID=A0ABV0ZTW5_9TELE